MESSHVQLLTRAAGPYAFASVEGREPHAAREFGSTVRTSWDVSLKTGPLVEGVDPTTIWVDLDEVGDILLLAGVPESQHVVETSIRSLGVFLPGIEGKRICFQVMFNTLF